VLLACLQGKSKSTNFTMADKNNIRLELPVWPEYEQDEIEAVVNVLRLGKGNTWVGQGVKSFENEFADYIGMPYGVAVCNGTVSLELALYALGIGDGDDVIVPARSFIATASSVVTSGAKPVFADVDLKSQNITLDTIKDVITKDTRAIIVVHLSGWPCEMDAISKYARQNNIKLIEDCAQAHGAKYNDQYVGSFGDASSFSFCQDKIISTGGEGGLLLLRDKKVWERAWSYKDHGKDYNAVFNERCENGFAWVHNSIGTNWRLTEMQAAIGRIQLKKLDSWVDQRKKNAQQLTKCFRKIEALRVTTPDETISHAYYKYYAFVRPEMLKPEWDRIRILNEIIDNGVPCFTGSCPEIYKEKAFEDYQGSMERLPIAKELGETSLMFLVHPTLGEKEIRYVCTAVNKVMQDAVL